LKRKNGTVLWGWLGCRRVNAADGRLLYYEGLIEDITG
jgi:hypothetical protein